MLASDQGALPIDTFDKVHHVGTLDPGHRKPTSYEGSGFSVSIHPHEWMQIAKLPGYIWTITRTDGEPLRFVSWHDLTGVQRDHCRAWGVAQGWVAQREVFRVTWHDSELDDTVYMDCDTHSEATAEAEHRDGTLARVAAWRPTVDFPDPRVYRDGDPTDVLLAHWVRLHRPDLDGIWWHDTFDPDNLSCPRGVLIHPFDRYEMARL